MILSLLYVQSSISKEMVNKEDTFVESKINNEYQNLDEPVYIPDSDAIT